MTEVCEAKVKFVHDCWSPYASELFPDVKVIVPRVLHVEHHNLSNAYYLKGNNKQELKNFIDACRKHSTVKSIEVEALNKNWAKMYLTSNYDRTSYKSIISTGCFRKSWYVSGGFEEGTIVADSLKSFRGLISEMKEVGEIKVISKKQHKIDTNIVEYSRQYDQTLIEFILALTSKQKKALKLAINGGHYGFPRKITLENLSDKMGIALSTYQQHLQTAEQKLVSTVIDILEDGELREIGINV